MASSTSKDNAKGPVSDPVARRPLSAAGGAAIRATRRATPVGRPKFTVFSRSVVIGYCAALCLGVTFIFAGGQWLSVLYRLLADGLMLSVWLACAAGLGTAVLMLFPLGDAARGSSLSNRPGNDFPLVTAPGAGPLPITGSTSELLYWVTAIAIGLGLFSVATLGLGLAGWLNYSTAVALLALGGLLGVVAFARSDVWRDRDTFGDAAAAWLAAPARWGWLWLLAMPLLALSIIAALLPPGAMWPAEPHWYDVVSYHLQLPREWYDLGRIVPLQHNVFSYFPLNVEMHYLLAMHLRGGPWSAMYVAHFMHLSMVALTVMAVYGFARADAPSRANAVIAAVAAAVVPWMAQVGSLGYNEGGLLLFGTLAMGWAFRAALDPSRRLGRFPVAGLMAGFACGCKLTAVPEVLLAVGGLSAVGVILSHRAARRAAAASAAPDAHSNPAASEPAPAVDGGAQPPADAQSGVARAYASPQFQNRGPALEQPDTADDVPLRTRLAGVAIFFVAGLVAFAPWLVKNTAWAGNPVFPEAAALLGQAHFSDTQVERWKLAHSAAPEERAPRARLSAWAQQVWGSWQFGYLLIPLGLVAASAAYERPGTWLLLGMLVILSIIWLGFTHLQGRFFILAIPIAALLLARMDWGPAPWAGALLVLVAAAYGFHRLNAVINDRMYDPSHQLILLLAKERLDEATRDSVFVNIPNSAPVVATFALTLDDVPPGTPIALVGDARPFFYVIPSKAITYRTVFDVDAKQGESVLDAWAGGAPPNAVRLVDPEELRRFHRTYHGIPEFPSWYEDRLGPFILPPAEQPLPPGPPVQSRPTSQPQAAPVAR